jgi:DNA-binding MarR family transcriptional regulator
VRLVELTAKGRELVAKAFDKHAVAMEKATRLSKEERLELLELLKKFGKGAEHKP